MKHRSTQLSVSDITNKSPHSYCKCKYERSVMSVDCQAPLKSYSLTGAGSPPETSDGNNSLSQRGSIDAATVHSSPDRSCLVITILFFFILSNCL